MTKGSRRFLILDAAISQSDEIHPKWYVTCSLILTGHTPPHGLAGTDPIFG
jgi:hypothetical protein